MSDSPVFFDPHGKRAKFVRGVTTLLLFSVVGVIIGLLAIGLYRAPKLKSVRVVPRSTTYQDILLVPKTGSTVLAPALRQALERDLRKKSNAAIKKPFDRTVIGYYAPYESTGLASFSAHADALTHIVPQWLHLDASGREIDYTRDYDPDLNPKNHEVERIAKEKGVRIIPILDNYGVSDFDRHRSALLLQDADLQQKLALELAAFLSEHGYDGIHLDFEELNGADSKGLVRFATELKKVFAPKHLSVSSVVEVGNDEIDAAALAEPCDFIVPMLYDQHSEDGAPGPIASLDWAETQLDRILRTVPESKVVMGVGNFGYDWTPGQKRADSLSFQTALSLAAGYRSESPDQVLHFDPQSSNTTFAYRDDDDRLHRVWTLDALSAYNQLRAASDRGIRGAALWVLGDEDPAIWRFFNRRGLFGAVRPEDLNTLRFAYEVSFLGRGEILNVRSRPSDGRRSVRFDSDGLVESCRTLSYASPYVVAKSGYVPNKLALTFDDGPDPTWTPQILDVLRRHHIPGTFFCVGANVEAEPGLVRREYDEGHEVGNHSFTHPDLGSVPPSRAILEINLTQMAIAGATGHTSDLFRPPYNADSEPETPNQLTPVLEADRLGYVTVGENVDPTDWDAQILLKDGRTRPRTADDIAQFVIDDLKRRKGSEDEGNIILLHDAGGDRAQTVIALDRLIPRLQAQGYTFVRVSTLMGERRQDVMPSISTADRLKYAFGRWSLGAAFGLSGLLATLFDIAIVLGIARTALVIPLAVAERRRRCPAPSGVIPSISVVVAAYDEEAVIGRTIESILQSDVPISEVVVVDDGSSDATAKVVRDGFGSDPRVILLQKENGGKASALNEGIARARGDLLFHIDADTVIEPTAIGRLAAGFDDPQTAAVAGNVQVGNRSNLLTQWQDLEYVTSQNLDRRAYARLNCITVVPGAIGMWRRNAVLEVGGYETDTLAEDMDLTWRLRRAGYRLRNEPLALAYTEAPERLEPFLKQRFRWSYGTLQCLVKHRGALCRYGCFGWLALPTLWAFGVAFQALAPLVDLQILLAVLGFAVAAAGPSSENRSEALAHAGADFSRLAAMYAVFLVVELLGGGVALRFEGKPLSRLLPLLVQRFVYRQTMYFVMFKSLVRALTGGASGWGKLARTGSVRVPASDRLARTKGLEPPTLSSED